MELRQIKLYDWNVSATQALPGEENACIISFRLANVIGLEHFINCFKSVKEAIESPTGFNAFGIVAAFVNAAAQIYGLLKSSKKSVQG